MSVARVCANLARLSMQNRNVIAVFPSIPHLGNVIEKKRFYSTQTTETLSSTAPDTLLKRIASKLPFININKKKLLASGYILYEGIADHLSYVDFFDDLNLPDTFYSWFVITELHVWLLSVRAMAEGDDGRLVRKSLIEAMWADVAQRVKKLGAGNPAATRAQVFELSEQLQAALISYDEGLLSDDTVLAGALWRRFYQQGDVDPRKLDDLVRYIRRQVRVLESLSREEFTTKQIRWNTLINS